MRKYHACGYAFGGVGMRLGQLLEQEGQPCSYCIAVFLLKSNGERLSMRDTRAYERHLQQDHGLRPFVVEP